MKLMIRMLERAQRSSDVALALVMAAILGALIVPLPPWLLDAGIAVNLAASAALLVAALFAQEALKVASFPTLLLLTTLFRVALNVSSTRLALGEGHAGEIIQAFGEFVVRGEYVVGAVIFAILTLVQFLVVAKGAERVAEVSARFTLDAMPGKQMSIDADLRAGAIDQAQARARRRALERESQMFGAMDGAMKFVKGDVVAGLVIVLINLVGGSAIGVLQHGLPLSEAAATYALIAIGDGLVSQVASLCIAVAAGLVVTRVAGETDEASLGGEIGAQFFGKWKALAVVSGLCLALGLLPGMPKLTFLVLALLTGAVAYALRGRGRQAATEDGRAAPEGGPASAPSARPEPQVGVSPLVLDLSAELSVLTREEGGRFVTEELTQLREQLYLELGLRLPGIRVRTEATYLPARGYALLVDELPCGRGQLVPDCAYALVPRQDIAFLQIDAEPAVDPADGRPISRIPVAARARAEMAQVVVRSPRQMLLAHIAGLLRKRAGSLLGVQDVQQLLEGFEPQAPALVKAALDKVPLPLLTDVLRRLLQEEVSIRNLRVILEALVLPTTAGDATALTERCRQALRRYLSHKYAPSGPLYAYLVDPDIEQALREGGSDGGLEPSRVSAILEGIKRLATNGRAVLLASPDVRRSMRGLVEAAFPEVAVLTFSELDPELPIRPIGKLVAQSAR